MSVIKYLVSLFLIFGITVNAGFSYLPEGNVTYFKRSEVVIKARTRTHGIGFYSFKSSTFAKRLFRFIRTFLHKLLAAFGLKVQTLIDLQTEIHLSLDDFMCRYPILLNSDSSDSSYSSLYIG